MICLHNFAFFKGPYLVIAHPLITIQLCPPTKAVDQRSFKNIIVFANTLFLTSNPIDGKICKMAFRNISWKQRYWHDFSWLVYRCNRLNKCISRNTIFTDWLTDWLRYSKLIPNRTNRMNQMNRTNITNWMNWADRANRANRANRTKRANRWTSIQASFIGLLYIWRRPLLLSSHQTVFIAGSVRV